MKRLPGVKMELNKETDKYGVVHGVAHCLDCEWSTESYKNAQAISAKHARKYGHRVEGELGIAFSYDYRGSCQNTEVSLDGW